MKPSHKQSARPFLKFTSELIEYVMQTRKPTNGAESRREANKGVYIQFPNLDRRVPDDASRLERFINDSALRSALQINKILSNY
jgi:hypothetical protein